MAVLAFHNKKDAFIVHTKEDWGRWLIDTLPLLSVKGEGISSFVEVEQSF